jgi:hypothetical protein
MKPVAAVFVLSLVLPAAAVTQVKPDFSGSWKMDETRSASAVQSGFVGPVVWRITQEPDQLKVEMQRASKAFTRTFVIDASKPKAAGGGATAGAPGFRAHWDGDALVTESTQTIQGQTVTTSEVLTLSSSGQELNVERTVNVHHGYTVRGAQSSVVARDTFTRTAP